MKQMEQYYFWSLGDRSTLRNPQRGVYPRFMPVPSTQLTSNQMLQKRRAGCDPQSEWHSPLRNKLFSHLSYSHGLDYQPQIQQSEDDYPREQGNDIYSQDIEMNEEPYERVESLVEFDRSSSPQSTPSLSKNDPSSNSPISEKQNDPQTEPQQDKIKPLEMNIALAAVLKRNPGLQESLQDEIESKPGWYAHFKRDLDHEAQELQRSRHSEDQNRAREIVNGLFAQNSQAERRSLSVLRSPGSHYSEVVQRELVEREKLELERKNLRMKSIELEMKLLKLKSENDFERKLNELEILRNN